MAALDSPRYRGLLRELELPPALREGERLKTAAAAKYDRLRRTVKRLAREPGDEELHRVRIKAKRARYAAEAVGGDEQFVARAKDVQDVLGEHRTALAAGRLVERQRTRRAAARAAWPKAWKRLGRAGDDAWR